MPQLVDIHALLGDNGGWLTLVKDRDTLLT